MNLNRIFEIHGLTIYTEDGGEFAIGYIHARHGESVRAYEFLYRINDDKNGNSHKLISIDHAYTHNQDLLKYWCDIESEIKSILTE